ncbi:PLP-dependent aminotransferase family protein [Amphritea sp. 2_MG-2023]|uniref:aminotransferase-like domain-containing protein n=1 Tax=Amphritea TaxID=515417 RepID=UPI001C0666D0|nr:MULTISPECIES: PLP-dependent aminotransferase family protein [Amphritea]MBU2964541.1 PLP-dependent aminotransferase family protein [Amphritea atlantica]MDO6417870.1 PLP-dependent aminotransferase family protein [Amphritea sp. 2_MG-2023]
MKLYEQVASTVKDRIDLGYYREGDKLPSVRGLSQEHGVSISTVQEAYGLLMDDGVIESRPKSGYYVLKYQEIPELPATSSPIPEPLVVAQWQKLKHIIQEYHNQAGTKLSLALPDTETATLKPLIRLIAELSRTETSRILNYESAAGSAELCHQIARLAVDSGCRLNPDEIITTIGCQEALSCSLRAVTEPGDIVVVDSPSFFGSVQAIKINGVKALEIPTHPETGISLEALEMAFEQWPIRAVLLTPTNNNPLGYSMPDKHKIRLLALLKRYDIPLIEDDIYGDLSYTLPRPRTVKSFDTEGRVILCSSFSKSVAPGLRVGWVAPGRYREHIIMVKYLSSLSTPPLTQMALAEFIAQGYYEKHLRKMRINYQRDRDAVISWLKRDMPEGTRISYPQGGYLLWIELPSEIDTNELNRLAMLESISIAPGTLFSASGKYKNFMRISCVNSANPAIEKAVTTLGRLCKEMQAQIPLAEPV